MDSAVFPQCFLTILTRRLTRSDLSCNDATASRFAYGVIEKVGEVRSSRIHTLAMGSTKSSGENPVFPVPVRGAKPASVPLYDDAGNLQSEDFVEGSQQPVPRFENGVYWYVTTSTFGFTSNEAVLLVDMDMHDEECQVLNNAFVADWRRMPGS